MKSNSRIIIFGHNNMIGKALIKCLKKLNYKNITVSYISYNDTQNYNNKLINIFKKIQPEYVFLVDGESGGIMYNQKYPVNLMISNLLTIVNIFPLAKKFKVKKLLFFASSCIYPNNAKQPLKPKLIMSDFLETTNVPYAIAKIAGLELCKAYNNQYGTNFITVIPSNHFGPYDDFGKKNSHVIPALIAKMHEAKINNKKSVKIWGSGKPIRDFIYVDDLALASVFIIKNYKSKSPINITSGESFSIKEIANIIKRVVGFKGKLNYDASKSDGMLIKTLDNSSILKLGWKNSYTFSKALKTTYSWYKNKIL